MSIKYLSVYYTCKNVRKLYKSNVFKILAPTWAKEFELSDESYYVSDIQDYFEYIIKKHETLNLKLSDSQLSKLKSAPKNATHITL